MIELLKSVVMQNKEAVSQYKIFPKSKIWKR